MICWLDVNVISCLYCIDALVSLSYRSMFLCHFRKGIPSHCYTKSKWISHHSQTELAIGLYSLNITLSFTIHFINIATELFHLRYLQYSVVCTLYRLLVLYFQIMHLAWCWQKICTELNKKYLENKSFHW